jgi:hypothetical protein
MEKKCVQCSSFISIYDLKNKQWVLNLTSLQIQLFYVSGDRVWNIKHMIEEKKLLKLTWFAL